MPPPPSYVDITPTPFSQTITQAEFNGGTFGGTANTCWFRYIASAPLLWLGSFTDKGGTFVPDARVYGSDGTTLLFTAASGLDVSWSFVLPGADTYYIKVTRHGGGASNFDFSSQFDVLPVLTVADVPAGSLIVNDDTDTFPATVINNDVVIGVLPQIPAGEMGAALPIGQMLWWDRFNQYSASPLAIFDETLTYVTSVDTTGTLGSSIPLIGHSDTEFFVVDPNDSTVYRVTTAGIITQIATTTGTNVSAVGVSRDGTILYWAEGSTDGILKRWDLVNDVALADLYAIPGFVPATDVIGQTPNVFPGEIIVLPDDSIVTFHNRVADSVDVLLHVAADGSLLGSFDYAWPGTGTATIDHLSEPLTGSDSVQMWFITDDVLTMGRFAVASLADGSLSTGLSTDLFSAGNNLVTESATLFAPSESCTMLSFLFATAAAASSEAVIGPLLWIHWPRVVPG